MDSKIPGKKIIAVTAIFLLVGIGLGLFVQDSVLISGQFVNQSNPAQTDSPISERVLFRDRFECDENGNCDLNNVESRLANDDPHSEKAEGVDVRYYSHDYADQEPQSIGESVLGASNENALTTADLSSTANNVSKVLMKIRLPEQLGYNPDAEENIEHPVYAFNFRYKVDGIEAGDVFTYNRDRMGRESGDCRRITSDSPVVQGDSEGEWRQYFDPELGEFSDLESVANPQCVYMSPDEEHLVTFTLRDGGVESNPTVKIDYLEVVAYAPR